MTTQLSKPEARRRVRQSTDPQELLEIYEAFQDSADIVKAIVNNRFCPDEIKKRYVLYALEQRLPAYVSQLGPSGRDILDTIGKSLEAWEPVQRLAPTPSLDQADDEAMRLYEIAQKKRAIILYGPPGTSKTYLAAMIANALTDSDEHRIKFVQFHASYAYEDFIEGIVPKPHGDGIIYDVDDKVFKEFCKAAEQQQSKRYVLIIDEINRADLSKVFGEVFTCLEYRGQPVQLLYSRKPFIIPSNLILIGTMNNIDRSTTELDFAFRRRFFFFEVPPRVERLEQILNQNGVEDGLKTQLLGAFQAILSRPPQSRYPLGHAYFKDVKTVADVQMVWEHQLKPLLEQYFEFSPENVTQIGGLLEPIWTQAGRATEPEP